MRYRLGKLSDLRQIVNLHYKVRNTYNAGYFAIMGKLFITEYYKIILNDPYEVVICAEDESGILRGFCTASLDVNAQFNRLNNHKFILALAALPTFITKPRMIIETWKRYRAIKGKNMEKFITQSGPRCEYWTWDSDFKDSASSVALFNICLSILYELGINILRLEVDIENVRILNFHKLNGAEVIEKITLLDGRKRAILHYNLISSFEKNKR